MKENARSQSTVATGLGILLIKIACNSTFEECYFTFVSAKNMELDQLK